MLPARVSLSAADLWLGRQTRTAKGSFAEELAKAEANLEEVQLKEAAVEIEAIFLQQLLVQMRRTVPKDDHSQGFWHDLYDAEMARVMAEKGGLGLGEMIIAQLKK